MNNTIDLSRKKQVKEPLTSQSKQQFVEQLVKELTEQKWEGEEELMPQKEAQKKIKEEDQKELKSNASAARINFNAQQHIKVASKDFPPTKAQRSPNMKNIEKKKVTNAREVILYPQSEFTAPAQNETMA